jgi:lysozyme family protein
MELYKRDYWDCLRCDALTDARVAFQLLESAVHMDAPRRPNYSVKIAQGALIIHGVDIVYDGLIGPQTVAALNAYPHKASLLKWMNVMQGAALMAGAAGEKQLVALVKKRLSQLQTFGRGWGRRLAL